MPIFKEKNSKKKKLIPVNTLDTEHRLLLNKFKENNETTIPQLKIKLQKYKEKKKIAKTIDEKLELTDKIKEL